MEPAAFIDDGDSNGPRCPICQAHSSQVNEMTDLVTQDRYRVRQCICGHSVSELLTRSEPRKLYQPHGGPLRHARQTSPR
jgi:hypothetical protein